MRRAIDVSMRRIDCSRRVIEASERLVGRQPLRAPGELLRVANWLSDAVVQLHRASVRLEETSNCLALAPEPIPEAPALVVDATLDWFGASAWLLATQDRLGDLTARVVRCLGGERYITLRPAAPRWSRQYCQSRPSDRILRQLLKRRRRVAPAAVAEAPRRISRGRAPPFVSICLL
jgi:hypothetical protein